MVNINMRLMTRADGIMLDLNSYKLFQLTRPWLKENRPVSDQNDRMEIEEVISSVGFPEDNDPEHVQTAEGVELERCKGRGVSRCT